VEGPGVEILDDADDHEIESHDPDLLHDGLDRFAHGRTRTQEPGRGFIDNCGVLPVGREVAG
jgi:hypothetical protein